jgi:5-methylcytosine-specific restriction endonuclease McrBC regulatory subunit McrC
METISLKDFSPVGENFELCRNLQESIYRDSRDIITINGEDTEDDGLRIFDYYNGRYYTQKYVGAIIDENGKKFVIGSRFDRGEKQFFLQYVFAKAFDVNGKIFQKMMLDGKAESTFDILLIIMFIMQLKKALRKGIFRRYTRFEYNESRVRGQIDIARHINLNPLPNGKIACSTREYTANNYYNKLIIRALEIIRNKYPLPVKNLLAKEFEVKKSIEMLKVENVGYGSVRIDTLLKNTEKGIPNSVYRDYEPLRKTARIILRHMGINAFSEKRSRAAGVLIDMTKLWENFLEKTVFKDYSGDDIAQNQFPVLNSHRVFKPDFYLKKKSLVIDAKYRSSWSETLGYNKSWNSGVRNDVFQIFAYMLSLKCEKGGVIFPVSEEWKSFKYGEKLSVFPQSENNTDKYFFRIPYIVPQCDNYKEFVSEIEKNDEKISALMKSI